jgi:hypothetical protein
MEDDDFDDDIPTIDEELAEQDKGCAAVYSFHTIKYLLDRIEHDKLHPAGSEFGALPD